VQLPAQRHSGRFFHPTSPSLLPYLYTSFYFSFFYSLVLLFTHPLCFGGLPFSSIYMYSNYYTVKIGGKVSVLCYHFAFGKCWGSDTHVHTHRRHVASRANVRTGMFWVASNFQLLKMTAFWDVSCGVIGLYRRFRGACCLYYQGIHRLDEGGSKLLWNIGKLLPDFTVQHPRKQSPSYPPVSKSETFQTWSCRFMWNFETRCMFFWSSGTFVTFRKVLLFMVRGFILSTCNPQPGWTRSVGCLQLHIQHTSSHHLEVREKDRVILNVGRYVVSGSDGRTRLVTVSKWRGIELTATKLRILPLLC
jgi:hypothetical protein